MVIVEHEHTLDLSDAVVSPALPFCVCIGTSEQGGSQKHSALRDLVQYFSFLPGV